MTFWGWRAGGEQRRWVQLQSLATVTSVVAQLLVGIGSE